MLCQPQVLLVILLLPLVLGQPKAHASEQPKAVLPTQAFNFGKVVQGTAIEHTFVLRNEGTSPLKIQELRMTAPLRISHIPAEIGPGKKDLLGFTLDTSTLQGQFEGAILLTLNDPSLPEAELSFEGQVVGTVEVSPMSELFVAGLRGQSKQASIDIINHEPRSLSIESIEHPTQRFSTKLEVLEKGQRYRLTLVLNPDGPAGRETATILVTTSSKAAPLLRIAANTYLHERVYTFPDEVYFGALRLADFQLNQGFAQLTSQTLMVYQSGGSDFKIELSTDLPFLSFKSEPGPLGDRHQITITLIREKLVPGPIQGSIVIVTNDQRFPAIKVPVSGRIISSSGE
jgi:Protein of unknown function (DUF1573)